jgi:hypothetical protein
MTTRSSRAIAKKTTAILTIVVVLTGTFLWLYRTGQPPFCSGYPPGGNCPGTITNTFPVSVNYSGSWQATYYGFHGGARSSILPSNGTGSYTSGRFGGIGPSNRNITLSGPNSNVLLICVQVQKLDSSNSTLSLGIDTRANSTSLPFGIASLCAGVAV